MTSRLLLALGLFTVVAMPLRAEISADPLLSPVWKDLAKKTFGTAEIQFDDRVKVLVPKVVENQAQVPIIADARQLANVEKLLIIADLNPIQHVLTFTVKHGKAEAFISFRMKVEQATPVRAAALTSDGVWHIGGVNLEAAGGGCSAASMARGVSDWTDTLGNSQGRMWRKDNGAARLRFRVRHPMDTGLAKDNTPAFFIEKLDIKGATGDPLATLEMFEPVSEDPTVTIELKVPPSDASVNIDGRDNNGTIYRSTVPAPWNESTLATAQHEPRPN